MKKIILLFFCTALWASAQERFRTMPVSDNIKTLQVGVDGEKFSLPVITFGGSNFISIQFDEMSHDVKNYYYSIHHCNADWTSSSILDMEAIDGVATGVISDYLPSINTTFLYTHYSVKFPNDDVKFKLSGNYRVMIFEDNDPQKLVAVACFSVVDPKVSVTGTVRGNTDVEINKRMQQLDFEIDNGQLPLRDVFSELKVIVQQNRRYDNQVTDLKPSYTTPSKQRYVNNPALIFEGGNEYRSFDFSSVYTFGGGVENIHYFAPYYHVTLYPDAPRIGKAYEKQQDVNGRFAVNVQDYDDDARTADYMFVHFSIPTEKPFFEGSLYIGGDLHYNLFDKNVRMEYNAQHGAYEQTLLLKQGGYNYMYAFVKKGDVVGSLMPVEGSLWQTANEYEIYTYYRGWGQRYDQLVGVQIIE